MKSLSMIALLGGVCAEYPAAQVFTPTTWKSTQLRGLLSDGGGTGNIMIQDGDEAVIISAAHGTNTDIGGNNKKNYDNWAAGAVDPSNDPSGLRIVKEVLDFERQWEMDDPGACSMWNSKIKVDKSKLVCTKVALAGGADGADVAIFHIKLSAAAQAAHLPTYPLNFSYFPGAGSQVNTTVQNSGYGCTSPCAGDGSNADPCPCTLSTGHSKVYKLFTNQFWSYGINQFKKFPGEKISTDCSGDSGGATFAPGTTSIIGLNSQGDSDFKCPSKQNPVCAGTAATASWVYPQRKWIKDVVTKWKPAWASQIKYQCEPPSTINGACQSGCKSCPSLEGELGGSDCYPAEATCPLSSSGGLDNESGNPCHAEDSGAPKKLLCKGVKDKSLNCRQWSVRADIPNGNVALSCVKPTAGKCPEGYFDCKKQRRKVNNFEEFGGSIKGKFHYLR